MTRPLAGLALLWLGACASLTGPEDGRVVVRVDGATCGAQAFTVDVFIAGERRATQTVATDRPGDPIPVPPGTWAVSARVPGTDWIWAPLMASIPENGTYHYLLACPLPG
jgi:hypothetical protein